MEGSYLCFRQIAVYWGDNPSVACGASSLYTRELYLNGEELGYGEIIFMLKEISRLQSMRTSTNKAPLCKGSCRANARLRDCSVR